MAYKIQLSQSRYCSEFLLLLKINSLGIFSSNSQLALENQEENLVFSGVNDCLKLGFVQIYMPFTDFLHVFSHVLQVMVGPESTHAVNNSVLILICSGVLARQLSGQTEHRTEAHVEVLATEVANLIFLHFHYFLILLLLILSAVKFR